MHVLAAGGLGYKERRWSTVRGSQASDIASLNLAAAVSQSVSHETASFSSLSGGGVAKFTNRKRSGIGLRPTHHGHLLSSPGRVLITTGPRGSVAYCL